MVHVVKLTPGKDPAYSHLIQGEGACLVCAKYRGCAQSLQSWNAAGENSLERNAPGPQGEEDREDYRKFFREQRHGKRDAGQDSVEPIVPREAVENHRQGTERQSNDGQISNQPSGLSLQRRILGLN